VDSPTATTLDSLLVLVFFSELDAEINQEINYQLINSWTRCILYNQELTQNLRVHRLGHLSVTEENI
jgi:hypothetical protein